MADEKETADTSAVEGMRFALQKPINALGETVKVLTFREPTGADLMEVGNPVILDMASDPPVIAHDAKRMTAMISRLAGVPPSSLRTMAPQDWVGCAWLLTPFFVPAPGTI